MKPFSAKMTGQLLGWYQKQQEIERWECHVEQRNRINVIMNNARKEGLKVVADGELYYNAFLYGIYKRSRLQSNKRLRTTDDLEAVSDQRIAITKAKAKLQKPSPKRDRLLGVLRPVVEKCRRDGLSWQSVSNHLALHHKIRCSRGYLQGVFAGLIE